MAFKKYNDYDSEVEICIAEVYVGKEFQFFLYLTYNPMYKQLTVSCWNEWNNGYVRYSFCRPTVKRALDCVGKSIREDAGFRVSESEHERLVKAIKVIKKTTNAQWNRFKAERYGYANPWLINS